MQGLEDASALSGRRRFRFIIALALLALLWWFVLDALDSEAQRVEQLTYERALSQLRSVLMVKGAEIMLDPNVEHSDVEGANPFDWMESPPRYYNGTCKDENFPMGWCFSADLQNKTQEPQRGRLIYRTRGGIEDRELRLESGGALAWRVEASGGSGNEDEMSLDGGGAGLKLARVSADKPNKDNRLD